MACRISATWLIARKRARITILEGIHSLCPAVRRTVPATLGIFVTAAEPVMRAARYERDAACNNLTAWEERWASLSAGYETFISPYEQDADLTITVGATRTEAHINHAALPRACNGSCALRLRRRGRNSASRRHRPSASSSSAPRPSAHDETP